MKDQSTWEYPDTQVKTENTDFKHPDAKKHQVVSFVKSTIRIIGYTYLPFNLQIAATILIISEVVGILEELV